MKCLFQSLCVRARVHILCTLVTFGTTHLLPLRDITSDIHVITPVLTDLWILSGYGQARPCCFHSQSAS